MSVTLGWLPFNVCYFHPFQELGVAGLLPASFLLVGKQAGRMSEPCTFPRPQRQAWLSHSLEGGEKKTISDSQAYRRGRIIFLEPCSKGRSEDPSLGNSLGRHEG